MIRIQFEEHLSKFQRGSFSIVLSIWFTAPAVSSQSDAADVSLLFLKGNFLCFELPRQLQHHNCDNTTVTSPGLLVLRKVFGGPRRFWEVLSDSGWFEEIRGGSRRFWVVLANLAVTCRYKTVVLQCTAWIYILNSKSWHDNNKIIKR